MQPFIVGSRLRFTETFTDAVSLVLVDPTTVAFKTHDPSGIETVYTLAGSQVIRDSVGVYHYDLTVTTPGLWVARWVAGGAVVAADEIQFTVRKSLFTTP